MELILLLNGDWLEALVPVAALITVVFFGAKVEVDQPKLRDIWQALQYPGEIVASVLFRCVQRVRWFFYLADL